MCGYNTFDLDWTLNIALSRVGDSLSYIADVIGWNSNGVFYALSGKDLVGEQMCGYSALTLELHAYDRSVNAIGFFCLPFKKRSKELILTSL